MFDPAGVKAGRFTRQGTVTVATVRRVPSPSASGRKTRGSGDRRVLGLETRLRVHLVRDARAAPFLAPAKNEEVADPTECPRVMSLRD